MLAMGAAGAPRMLRAQTGRPEKPALTLAVGGKTALYYLPLTLAAQLGYFTAEGLDVKLQDHAGGGLAAQALQKGQADVVAGAFEHTLVLRQRGFACREFVLLGRAPQLVFAVSTRTPIDFRVLAQLKGHRIGVSAPQSSTHWFSSFLLGRAGMTAADVEYVGIGTSQAAVAALRDGRIDALANVDPVISMLELRNDVRVLFDTRTLRGAQDLYGGLMPAGCLYAPQEFVQRNPNTVQALTNAVVRALKWLQTAGPSDMVKAVPEAYMYGDRAVYLAALNKVRDAFSPDGLLPDEAVQTAARAVARYDTGLVHPASIIDLGSRYTNDFARRAKLKYMA